MESPGVAPGATVTVQLHHGGSSLMGRLFAQESSSPFSRSGLTILRTSQDRGNHNYCIILDDSIASLKSVPGDCEDVTVFPYKVTPQELVTMKVCAQKREAAALKSSMAERRHVGNGVSKVAQDLYDSFRRQLPQDTKWAYPNQVGNEDIIVLGVKVAAPYSSANCTAVDLDGQKSLRRISSMVTKFLRGVDPQQQAPPPPPPRVSASQSVPSQSPPVSLQVPKIGGPPSSSLDRTLSQSSKD